MGQEKQEERMPLLHNPHGSGRRPWQFTWLHSTHSELVGLANVLVSDSELALECSQLLLVAPDLSMTCSASQTQLAFPLGNSVAPGATARWSLGSNCSTAKVTRANFSRASTHRAKTTRGVAPSGETALKELQEGWANHDADEAEIAPLLQRKFLCVTHIKLQDFAQVEACCITY
ncbi:hypothetical protein E4U40_000548 [Claviceps sp. LM458 group G5]|nr:hypothetical protein E4U40_000548 [Claviceps sp. LM458 group G5]